MNESLIKLYKKMDELGFTKSIKSLDEVQKDFDEPTSKEVLGRSPKNE